MEQETDSIECGGKKLLQANRAQGTAGINYKFKDTHQTIIPEDVNSKAGIIKSGSGQICLLLLI
ncbi:MAG: hypothetical protein ACYC6P_03335 [Ignavibacteriaceae bacterium]